MLWAELWGGLWGGDCDLDKHRNHLIRLMPLGKAWDAVKDPGTLLFKLLEALALEYARVECSARRIIEEADVRTTSDLLEDWETFARPNTCGPIPIDPDARRASLHAKLTEQTNSSIPQMIEIAQNLGYTSVVITEFATDPGPFRVGISAVGDALQNGFWLYHFSVTAVRPASLADDTELSCLIDGAKQAHTTFELVIT